MIQVSINGVTFNVVKCAAMSREDFIAEMGAAFMQDMPAKERKAALSKAYTMIRKLADNGTS